MSKVIPKQGIPADELIASLETYRQEDVNWRDGRVFSLVYHAGEAHEQLLKRAHEVFASCNLLNPVAFKGLKHLEADVIDMAAALLNGPDTATGCVTSGGTESILLAMHAYRERARKTKPWIRNPEMVAPITIHPAFEKAAHYFGFRLRKVPVGPDMRADVKQFKRRISRNTICVMASAPQYPHGVVDPIADIAAIAAEKGIPMHVDACVGGYVLPWIEKLGHEIPVWDFRVPGVTSISADLHKYGYAAKGASSILWRSMEDMKYQFFIATEFPGGIYASPTIVGTRPGGPIAGAWVALQGLGEAGYMELTERAIKARDQLADGIEAIDGLRLVTRADGPIVAWTGEEGGPDVFAVADRIEEKGWSVDRQQNPNCVHLTCTANHLAIVDLYLKHLAEAVDEVRANPDLVKSGTAPMYGMMAKVPMRGMVAANVRKVMEAMYSRGVVIPDLDGAAKVEGVVGEILEKYSDQVDKAFDLVNAVKGKIRQVTRS